MEFSIENDSRLSAEMLLKLANDKEREIFALKSSLETLKNEKSAEIQGLHEKILQKDQERTKLVEIMAKDMKYYQEIYRETRDQMQSRYDSIFEFKHKLWLERLSFAETKNNSIPRPVIQTRECACSPIISKTDTSTSTVKENVAPYYFSVVNHTNEEISKKTPLRVIKKHVCSQSQIFSPISKHTRGASKKRSNK